MFGNFFNKMYYGNPRKKEITKQDIYSESRIKLFFEVLSVRFWKLIQLNLLYSVFCLSLFAIFMTLQGFVKFDLTYIFLLVSAVVMGPATAGLTYVLKKFAQDEHAWVWSDFKKAALRDLKPSIAIMLINVVLYILFRVNLNFYRQMAVNNNTLFMVLFFLMIGIAVVFFMMNVYIFPLLVSYELSVKDIYKNAFIFTVVKLPYTFLIALLCAAIIFFSTYIPLTIILIFVFTISFVGLIINSFANYVFDELMKPQEPDKQEQNDQE
ncbi:MAG: hypothetical protein PHP06_05660 [Clostridia bacterium]|nr:hypothetical protein [Clostridia bacterium]